ncbi:MAG: cysteine--tRNA ligase [Rhodospirillaceae bacterium]|nr:cysteine--tRNA ligase [Rhodospirillaceae bacterium]
MTQLALYNTLTKAKAPFEPANPKRVTMYVCGNTVYNFAHIGNARPAVVFDVLFRLLRRTYGNNHVIYARNVTDVDDKINAAAKEQGVDIAEITDRFTAAFNEDIGALGVIPPNVEPRATEHISEIVSMIKRLIASGHAYAAEGHVLYSVPSFDDYGRLSNRNRDDMIAGARVEVAPYKNDPADFVLWKPSTNDLPGWDSPWGPNGGRGRPGWHIECSAMIEKHLGETIDIHGGGNDLIFPHHENEIAQSRCSHNGANLAGVWMHNGMLELGDEKMSKSLGNVWLVRDLLQTHTGEAVRLALLSAHYRQPLAWSEDVVVQAKRTLDRLYGTLVALGHIDTEASTPPDAFLSAVADDLNTPKALAELSALAKAANTVATDADKARLKGEILASGALLGLLQGDPAAWLQGDAQDGDAEIEELIAARNDARANKDFAESDRIRDDLAAKGITLEDGTDGTKWRRAN